MLSEPRSIGKRLADSLSYRDDDIDIWYGPDVLLCRVHHETSNPDPQPVVSDDGNRRIIFWGDVYDTRHSRERMLQAGRSFRRVDDDAEFVLSLYEERGISAFNLLDGSFAIAIHDSRKKELLLSNDRFSSRPIYWATTSSGGLAFGTQVHTVLQVPGLPRDLDERSIQDILHYQRVHGTRTLNAAVTMLPPGTVLRARDGNTSLERWFDLEYTPENQSRDEWAEELAEGFRHSTNRSIDDAKRPGLLLSGGLDSRMVVAAADRQMECFHFNDAPNQEFQTARRIAEARNFQFTFLKRSEDHYVRLFDQAVDIGDSQQPFVHGHTIGLLPQDLDVMLHGFVPELYFRGKNLPHTRHTFGNKDLVTLLDRGITRENVTSKMVAKLAYSQPAQNPGQFLGGHLAETFDEAILRSAQELVDEARAHSDDPYDWFIWPDTHYHCKYPSFLFEQGIRAFCTERSVVFHNHILDLHLRMPVSLRSDSRLWNRAVKRLSPDIASLPDANTGHSPFLPDPIAFVMDKSRSIFRTAGINQLSPLAPGRSQHSWPNFRELIIYNDRLRELIRGVLSDPECLDPMIFNIPLVERAFHDHLAGRANYDLSLFQLATFGCWHRKYGPPGHALP